MWFSARMSWAAVTYRNGAEVRLAAVAVAEHNTAVGMCMSRAFAWVAGDARDSLLIADQENSNTCVSRPGHAPSASQEAWGNLGEGRLREQRPHDLLLAVYSWAKVCGGKVGVSAESVVVTVM